MLYIKDVKRVNHKSSHDKEKTFNFVFKWDSVHYCGSHFWFMLSQIVMLYTLNLYSVVC